MENIAEINFDSNKNLKELLFNCVKISSLNLSGMEIEDVSISSPLNTLDVSGNTSLKRLTFNSAIVLINAEGCTGHESLDLNIYSEPPRILKMKGCARLKEFVYQKNIDNKPGWTLLEPITDLDFTDCTGLGKIISNGVSFLNINGCKSLKEVEIAGMTITSLIF